MDAKIFVYGFCLVAIIAGASFWSYTMGMDDAQKEVILARQQMAAAEEGISKAKGWLTARKEAAALIAATGVIERDNQEIRSEIEGIKQKRKDIAKVFQTTIERARSETVGMTLPEIQLTTGAVLKNAKIQSIDKDITVFQHSQGVSKVSTSALPPLFQDRLRYESTSENPTGKSGSPSADTSYNSSASDRMARLGMSSTPTPAVPDSEQASTSTSTTPPAYTSTSAPAPTEGQRQSLGRTYVPGKGWQRVGALGTVAPPSLSSSSSGERKDNPEAVSKVKPRPVETPKF